VQLIFRYITLLRVAISRGYLWHWDLKSLGSNTVPVRVRLRAPFNKNNDLQALSIVYSIIISIAFFSAFNLFTFYSLISALDWNY